MKTKLWLVLAGAAFVLLTPRNVEAGACTCGRFHDWQDMNCNQNNHGTGGVPKAKCPDCNGMPRWWVSEPYINLCLSDTPLSYALSSGQEMDFTFYYRQRTKLPDPDEISNYYLHGRTDLYPSVMNCGTNATWGHNWNLSMVLWDASWEYAWNIMYINMPPAQPYYRYYAPSNALFSQGYEAMVMRPEGGIEYFNVPSQAQDPRNLARLQPVAGGGYPWEP